MVETVSNLVIITGIEKDITAFKKAAFLNDSRAFYFERLLAIPKDIVNTEQEDVWRKENYGNAWADGFSVILNKSSTKIEYYFNSKNTKANIRYIAEKYSELEFTHFYFSYSTLDYAFYGCESNFCNSVFDELERRSSNYGIILNDMDLQAETEIRTPAFVLEMNFKLKYLKSNNINAYEEALNASFDNWCNPTDEQFAGVKFYDLFPRTQFLKDNTEFYKKIFDIEHELWSKDISFAKKEIYYQLEINPYPLIKEIELSTITNKQELLIKINEIFKGYEKDKFQSFHETGALLEYISNSLDYKKEVLSICEKYIDNRIKRINKFGSNYNNYKKILKSYVGVNPCLDTSDEDFFIEQYLEANNWIDKDKVEQYRGTLYSLPSCDNFPEEFNNFEGQLTKTLIASKANSDKLPAEKLIFERMLFEKKATLHYKKSRIIYGDRKDFIPVLGVNTGYLDMLIEGFGMYISEDGTVEYMESNFFTKK